MPRIVRGKKKLLKRELERLEELEAEFSAYESKLIANGYSESLYRKLIETEIKINTLTGEV